MQPSPGFSLVARATQTGNLVNTASVSQSDPDPVPANGTSQATVGVTVGEPPSLPAPGAGELTIVPAGGRGQCIALKDGGGVCAPLSGGQQIELRDIAYINPGSGAVELQSIEGVGTLFGTPFALKEINATGNSRSAAAAQAKPVLIIKLIGGSYKQSALAAGGEQQAKRKPVRRLWGKGKGRFRTRGRYSSGTVRRTNWLAQTSARAR